MTLNRALKLAIALGLTTYLVWQSDPSRVLAATAGAKWSWLLAAIVLVIVDRLLMAWRWIALLDDQQAPLPPVSVLLRIFLVSTFLGNFLPATVGEVGLRAWSLSRERVSGTRALASGIMDRLLGVIALVLLTGAGLLLARGLLADRAVLVAIASAAAACAAAVALIYSRHVEALLQRCTALMPAAAASLASRLLSAIRSYSTRHTTVTLVLLGSLAVSVLRVVQVWMVGLALDVPAPAFSYFAFVPAIILIMMLPISVAGLGTTQLAFWWFFSRVGVPPATAIALSFVYLAIGIVGSLPGAVLWMMDRPAASPVASSDPAAGGPR